MKSSKSNFVIPTPKQRVRKGIKLLNALCPNWISKINLSKLNLTSFNNCPLGQIFNGWNNGIKQLNLDSYVEVKCKQQYDLEPIHKPALYGFDMFSLSLWLPKDNYRELENEWIKAIQTKLKQRKTT